jgi:hypothetical protein
VRVEQFLCSWSVFTFKNSSLLTSRKERKKLLGSSSSHFTLSRNTALSGIPKMPNILNQFQNKRKMTEEYQEQKRQNTSGANIVNSLLHGSEQKEISNI